jgi:hypothetical protein
MDLGAGEIPIHEKHYKAGDAWLFNSSHVHNAFNRSATHARYTLMICPDIRMKRTHSVIAPLAERYILNNEGPLMGVTLDV